MSIPSGSSTSSVKYELIGRVVFHNQHFTADLLVMQNEQLCTCHYDDFRIPTTKRGELEVLGDANLINLPPPHGSVDFYLYCRTSESAIVNQEIKSLQKAYEDGEQTWSKFRRAVHEVNDDSEYEELGSTYKEKGSKSETNPLDDDYDMDQDFFNIANIVSDSSDDMEGKDHEMKEEIDLPITSETNKVEPGDLNDCDSCGNCRNCRQVINKL